MAVDFYSVKQWFRDKISIHRAYGPGVTGVKLGVSDGVFVEEGVLVDVAVAVSEGVRVGEGVADEVTVLVGVGVFVLVDVKINVKVGM
jgi:hypothetical protein